ncbi:MAG: endolytic transglycosylase MltG [Bacteroidales bacterium]|jgi:UPF0755 protein|nr:endolytic transglycosylase MltG [Bacteroidales bacterium]
MSGHQKRRKHTGKIIGIIVSVLLIAGGAVGYRFYERINGVSVSVVDKNDPFLYIPSNSTFNDVCSLLREGGLHDVESFRWVAGKMHYPDRVKAGRYRLTDGMSNLELVRMLRAGRQIPVKVIFNNIRLNTQLAGAVASSIEADSAGIMALLTDSAYFAEHFKLAPQSVLSLFIPNTYEFFWNTSAKGFVERMSKEYDRFWTENRRQKAFEAGLTPLQVSILASIIEEETQMSSEKPVMAGVYINRLNRGMLLQADPTIRYAVGDFTIKRVLNRHKEIQSPYNTYQNTGLPPGPICIPSIASIDAVLNYVRHDYLFFCAKDDLSGYHNFARTLEQHNKYAQAYQKALNKLKIYK